MAILSRQPHAWLLDGAFWFHDLPQGYGNDLPFVYLMWLTVIAVLYLPCLWFMALRRRRSDWWLSYL
jgi:hypothetical protein